jgi:2-keto-4-pentenoate hydratase/2-oxohepta-3-ene-1,7-dioic acid hydratase in catechol pathway
MRLCTFLVDGQPELCALADGDRTVLRLQAAMLAAEGRSDADLADMLAYLAGGSRAFDTAQMAMAHALSGAAEGVVRRIDDVGVRQLSPLPRPESIREFMNFEQHVINCSRKFGMRPWRARLDEHVESLFGRRFTRAYRDSLPWYERPVYYKGNRFAVVGHEAQVLIPPYTRAFDWELEFGIVIGQGGRDIRKEDAHAHIGGYVVFNDFSARDIQGREMGGRLGPAKGKDFDTGNAIGPVLVTPDEVPDPYALAMSARINGTEVSRGHSGGMRFSFEEIIEYVSRSETLYPGEFFGSGTATVPESGRDRRGCGVEMGRFLQDGDVIELEVEHLGILRNHVAASPQLQPTP